MPPAEVLDEDTGLYANATVYIFIPPPLAITVRVRASAI